MREQKVNSHWMQSAEQEGFAFSFENHDSLVAILRCC